MLPSVFNVVPLLLLSALASVPFVELDDSRLHCESFPEVCVVVDGVVLSKSSRAP